MRYRIIYDRKRCMGEFSCVAESPDFWSYSEDGKADLNNARFDPAARRWELVIDEEDYDDFFAAAANCPAGVIMIEELQDEPVHAQRNIGDWKSGGMHQEDQHMPQYCPPVHDETID